MSERDIQDVLNPSLEQLYLHNVNEEVSIQHLEERNI